MSVPYRLPDLVISIPVVAEDDRYRILHPLLHSLQEALQVVVHYPDHVQIVVAGILCPPEGEVSPPVVGLDESLQMVQVDPVHRQVVVAVALRPPAHNRPVGRQPVRPILFLKLLPSLTSCSGRRGSA